MPIVVPKKVEKPLNIGPKMKKLKDSASESMRNELKASLGRLDMREKGLNTKQIINQNKINEFKVKVIQDIFKLMQENGVDPSSLESINRFLQSLEAQNPDLRELFENALNGVLGMPHTNMTIPESPDNSQDLTSGFSNLQNGMMMPR